MLLHRVRVHEHWRAQQKPLGWEWGFMIKIVRGIEVHSFIFLLAATLT